MNWKNAPWLVVDVETTGLIVGADKIVQLGVCYSQQVDGSRQKDIHCWTVNPGIHIPDEVSKLHGITDGLAAMSKPLMAYVYQLFMLVSIADVVAAYNFPFDAGFLEAELGLGWKGITKNKVIIDVLVLARHCDDAPSGHGRHRLENVAKKLELEWEGRPHHAGSDATIAHDVLDHLAYALPDDADEAQQLLTKWKDEQDADYRSRH